MPTSPAPGQFQCVEELFTALPLRHIEMTIETFSLSFEVDAPPDGPSSSLEKPELADKVESGDDDAADVSGSGGYAPYTAGVYDATDVSGC